MAAAACVLAAAGVGFAALKRYQPLQVGPAAFCCSATSSSQAEVGPNARGFFAVLELADTGSRAVHIQSIAAPEVAALSVLVRQPAVGFVDAQDVGLGAPVTPFHDFHLDPGWSRARFIELYGDVSHCPPIPIAAGLHNYVTIRALTIRWSIYGVNNTTHVRLAQPIVVYSGSQCSES
jgi:hypothetical protein